MSPAWRTRLVQGWAVIVKETAQLLSDRRMVSMLVLAPAIQLVVFGKTVNFDVDHVPTVVVDHDQTATSRANLRRLLADGTLEEVAQSSDEIAAMHMLDDNEAAVAVVVPEHFERDVLRGEPASVQVMLDGTDPNRAGVAGGAAARYFGEVALASIEAKGDQLGGVSIVPRVFYNPRLSTAIFMIPGITAMLLVSATTLVTSMGLAKEREMGTLEQVLVTPIPPSVLLVGKTVPYLAVGIFDVAVALAAGALVFDVPLRGSLLLAAFATLLYVMSTLGVGLLISTISSTQQQAFLGGFMFLMPANLLSGNFTPIASMPVWLRPLTLLNPLRYYIEVMRADMLKGAGFGEVWTELVALGVFGVLILGFSATRFHKTLA